MLCFHGDEITDQPWGVVFDGYDVSVMDGDEYYELCRTRVVHDEDVCDEWQGDWTVSNEAI